MVMGDITRHHTLRFGVYRCAWRDHYRGRAKEGPLRINQATPSATATRPAAPIGLEGVDTWPRHGLEGDACAGSPARTPPGTG